MEQFANEEEEEKKERKSLRIISQFEYGSEIANIGFLIEVTDPITGSSKRELVSEDDLIKTDSKAMYQYLKSMTKS